MAPDIKSGAPAALARASAAHALGTSSTTSRFPRIRASVTPYAQQYVRLGTSLHVDEADVDATVSSIERLQG